MKGQSEIESREAPNPSTRSVSDSPAPPFIVSAPGKTIVYGEHAVVHGKAAIAAAISLRTYLLVTTLSQSRRTVTLRFPDIGLDHTWNIPDLPWGAFNEPSRKRKHDDVVTSLDKDLVEAMQPHIALVNPDEKPEKLKIHHNAASCFLYLFLSLGSEAWPACIYTMRSTLPIGAGLGSSASVSVCLSTALLLQSRALSAPRPDQTSKEASDSLERINSWAFVGELVMHGNPSGVDNTVSTNGHAVLFQRTESGKPPKVSVLRDFPELPLLLVDTCQAKSTAAEVAKVGALKKTHPAVVDHILNAIDAITHSVYDRISSHDFDSSSMESVTHLGELMTVNHGLLTSLGVSHPRLERLKHLVDQAGVGWTKLTGAGGGGCAITLLKPEHSPLGTTKSSSALRDLETQLTQEGFEKYETTLGGDGVGLLDPAAVRNHAEIDQNMFLTAKGHDGIEQLVGDRKGQTGGGGGGEWKYWHP